MRSLVFTFVFALGLSGCSHAFESYDSGADQHENVAIDNPNAGIMEKPRPTVPKNADAQKSTFDASLQIDTYEDNKLSISYFFCHGLNVKEISYNSQTRKKEHETIFSYGKNGGLDYAKIDGVVTSNIDNIDIRRSIDNANFQYALINSKGVEFPLAGIVADEISDLSVVFSIADNYKDFKIDDNLKGNERTIKFIGFNKTCRFHNSPVSLLIGDGDLVHIQDYELTLEKTFPAREVYVTSKGTLTRLYSYNEGNLISVVYDFLDSEGSHIRLTKMFKYTELPDCDK